MRAELYELTEHEVADCLGLPLERVAELRVNNLFDGEDFGVVKRAIRYTAGGVEKLMGVVAKNAPEGVREADLELPDTKTAPVAVERGRATVVRVFPTNPKYLEAEMDGRTVTVRVRDNKNFMPGMVLEGLTAANERLYDFTGRCPKGRGRW